MKFIIIICIILLLVIYLLPNRKNEKTKSSNIILSDVNSGTCYDDEQSCLSDCKGYRCSDNCAPSSPCSTGPGCFGSEEECKTGCTPVFRCNSATGVVTEQKACGNGETGCSLSRSEVSANCIRTYSCKGSGPTGPTGYTTGVFGTSCLSGAVNCYNTSEQAELNCKGFRCSNNCSVAGAKCNVGESNCFPNSSGCSACPSGFRCSDNCARGSPCSANEAGCYDTDSKCKQLCSATYRCTPDKRCVQDYKPCSQEEKSTCFATQNECSHSVNTGCQKGFRYSSKCASGSMCLNEATCYDNLESCITNSKGYRCGDNCEEGKGCSPDDSTCYLSADLCKTSCTGYRCGVNNTCEVGQTKCTVLEVNNSQCFTVSNCLNRCSTLSVFDRIAMNENIKYKIVNIGNNRQLQGSNKQPAIANVKYTSENDTGNSMNPDQFWTFKNASNSYINPTWGGPQSVYGNVLSAFIVNSSGNQLACPQEYDNDSGKRDSCADVYPQSINGNTANDPLGATKWHRFFIIPVDDPVQRRAGVCRLLSNNKIGLLSLGCIGNGYCNLDGGSAGDPATLKIVGPDDAFSKWVIIPYTNEGVRIK